ncbi:MAG TPA: hypothetical protein VGN17_26170 [Bryobacteraceae bacterium]|jgi:hypothetical protein
MNQWVKRNIGLDLVELFLAACFVALFSVAVHPKPVSADDLNNVVWMRR